MMFAYCQVPIAPLRSHPRHEAEMTSQLVFGETCRVHEQAANGFFRIACTHDGYEGFCMGNQLMMSAETPEENEAYFGNWLNTVYDQAGHPMVIPFGSRWPRAFEARFQTDAAALCPQPTALTQQNLRSIAGLYINTPYLWGGRTVFGADCSGFVQMVMRAFGYALPRDASEQFAGISSQVRTEGDWGDLAFFESEGRIVHVGILLAPEQIIHAFGRVRIDRVDGSGIWNPEMGSYSHHLAGIRSLR